MGHVNYGHFPRVVSGDFHEKACRGLCLERFTFFGGRLLARSFPEGQASIRTLGGGVNGAARCREESYVSGEGDGPAYWLSHFVIMLALDRSGQRTEPGWGKCFTRPTDSTDSRRAAGVDSRPRGQ